MPDGGRTRSKTSSRYGAGSPVLNSKLGQPSAERHAGRRIGDDDPGRTLALEKHGVGGGGSRRRSREMGGTPRGTSRRERCGCAPPARKAGQGERTVGPCPRTDVPQASMRAKRKAACVVCCLLQRGTASDVARRSSSAHRRQRSTAQRLRPRNFEYAPCPPPPIDTLPRQGAPPPVMQVVPSLRQHCAMLLQTWRARPRHGCRLRPKQLRSRRDIGRRGAPVGGAPMSTAASPRRQRPLH
ncbi:hypothetical protein RA8CHR_01682 [Variovorax sp. RA8]|nr:hypothetical protein RA8CHR_01682 [Variovorax sp. RA8]